MAGGHKIAREDIPQGADVLKFGQVIGFATKPIAAGEHVHSHNCEFGSHDQDYQVGADLAAARAAIPRVATASFDGYRRANGPGGHAQHDRGLRHGELLGDGDPAGGAGGDGARACWTTIRTSTGSWRFAHGTGCGMAADGPGFDNLQRVLWGHATHPNVGAAVFVGLGCEVMQIARLKSRSARGAERFHGLTIQDTGGTAKTIARIVEHDPCAAARGEQGAARADAGVGAEAGAAVRRLGRLLGHHRQPGAGGGVRPAGRDGRHGDAGETPEIYGAEQLLLRRAASPEVAEKLIERIRWWEQYTR